VQVVTARRIIGACLAAALVALAVGVVATAGVASRHGKAAKPKIVKVKDNFYAPDSVKVKKRGKVRWKWAASNFNVHDVTLRKGPPGVDKSDFRSQTAQAPYTFTKKFKKAGKYKFYCTVHPDVMRMTVKVHR
jgi:plastocyanin